MESSEVKTDPNPRVAASNTVTTTSIIYITPFIGEMPKLTVIMMLKKKWTTKLWGCIRRQPIYGSVVLLCQYLVY